MSGTVLILGANGKIGGRSADAFWNAGWTVRRYKRGTDMIAAAQGCDVIVNGLNPPAYHNWAQLLPEITQQVIAAAEANNATIILPGNVYNFGDQGGEWSETTPQTPCSRKGEIRKQMEQSYHASQAQTIVLRAGNFIDPFSDDDVLDMVYLRDIKRGKVVSPGRADIDQAFCYVPDWARAAVQLADIRDQLDHFEDVPFPGHTLTARQMADLLQDLTQRKVKLAGFPWPIMTLFAPFWELARELREMRYLWNTPHRLSGAKFAALLPGFERTPIQQVLAQALADEIDPDQSVRSRGQAIAAQ